MFVDDLLVRLDVLRVEFQLARNVRLEIRERGCKFQHRFLTRDRRHRVSVEKSRTAQEDRRLAEKDDA